MTSYSKKAIFRNASRVREEFYNVQDDHLTSVLAAASVSDDQELEAKYRAIAGSLDAGPDLIGPHLEARFELAARVEQTLHHISEADPSQSFALVWLMHEGWLDRDRPLANLVAAKRSATELAKLGSGAIAVTQLGLFPCNNCPEGFVIVPRVIAVVSSTSQRQTESAVARLGSKFSSPVSGWPSAKVSWAGKSERLIAAVAATMFSIEDPLATIASRYARRFGFRDWTARARFPRTLSLQPSGSMPPEGDDLRLRLWKSARSRDAGIGKIQRQTAQPIRQQPDPGR
jgi:hypothetical protein